MCLFVWIYIYIYIYICALVQRPIAAYTFVYINKILGGKYFILQKIQLTLSCGQLANESKPVIKWCVCVCVCVCVFIYK